MSKIILSKSESLQAPVLILAYKRYDFLDNLLGSLPANRNIYIHIDGPRNMDKSDVAITNDVAMKYKIAQRSDCIHIFSQKTNLGNLGSFRASMEWVFAKEDRVIFLEEDIRFGESLFPFMDWALEKFENSNHIFQINGLSFLDQIPGKNRLYESYSCRPWGFGTWKSRWELYKQSNLPSDPSEIFKLPLFKNASMTESFKHKWLERFHRLNEGTDTYDLSWNYAAWENRACALAPRFTYTTNVGFDDRSLHTKIRPRGLRFPHQIKVRRIKFEDISIVPFPSFYDAYSDFIEWGTPGIKKGATSRIFIAVYIILRRLKRILNK
jgi:hypothetical protein